ncbi:Putative glutamate--cysteine ligase 2 [Amycolatopsis sp. CA-230715]|nr:Putative glutamate--cysteine ligase 2 [Amycolatopsis sp. CA-230715]
MVGVEEEYLLVDPRTRAVRPAAETVVATAAERLGDRVGTEITRFQVEVRTDPCQDLTALAEQVRATRRATAAAAARHGLRVMSSGTPVLGNPIPPPITEGARYARSVAAFRALDDEQSACACHVHIGLDDQELALRVSNHIRPWLPTLIAITANSPFWAGRDTGYASWRTMIWARWPVAGPPPVFHSVAHFDDLVGQLHATGAILDPGGLYWDIRPSSHVPTIEIRVGDAAPTVTDTVFLAAIVRALVDTAITAIAAKEPAPDPAQHLLRAAYWRAALDGLTGSAIDVRTGTAVPAIGMAHHLLTHLGPALHRNHDLDLARTTWDWIRARGTGADRQRQAHQRRNRLTDVVDALIIAADQANRSRA